MLFSSLCYLDVYGQNEYNFYGNNLRSKAGSVVAASSYADRIWKSKN
jgi:hypothetical protein